MGMLEDTHGSHDWHQMFSTPSDFGFCGTARDRTWVIGSHSELTQCRIDPYEVLEAIKCYFIDNEIQCRVSDYLIATEAEVRMEEMEAAQKLKLKNYIPGSSPRSLLLSHREAKVACELDEKYLLRTGHQPCTNPDLVYGLGDNADYCSWSAISGKIPTYRLSTSSSKYWVPAMNRWLTSKERLLSMGFPVIGEVATAMRVPLIGASDVKRASDIIGNSMHLQTSGIFQLLSLACFSPR